MAATVNSYEKAQAKLGEAVISCEEQVEGLGERIEATTARVLTKSHMSLINLTHLSTVDLRVYLKVVLANFDVAPTKCL